MRIIDDPDLLQALIDGAHYDVKVTVTPVGGSSVVIDASHIAENGISINPSSVSGNRLELGTVISATGDFVFYNHDGALDGIVFKGAALHAEGTATVNGTPTSFDIGYFIADAVEVNRNRISVSCFDKMILLDQPVNVGLLYFPMTVFQLLYACCSICGITFSGNATDFPNYDYLIPAYPDGSFTYRQIVSWAAQIMGRCAKINNKGEMQLVWYTSVADWDAALNHRFEGGEIAENPVTLTGVRVTTAGTVNYVSGASGYTLDISDNPLLQNSYDSAIDAIWADIGAMSYYPAWFDVIQNVLAEPFDVIGYEKEDGTVLSVAVTDVVLNLTARTAVQSKGISTQEAAYAAQNAFTPQQNGIIADGGRLKIGRIESNDGKVYFDLDTGTIHTQNTAERVTGSSTKSTYETELDFKDGEFTLVLQKDGVQIGQIVMGVDGLNMVMDESQGYSFRKPTGWDSWPAVAKAAWWTGQRIVASAFNADNVVNNSFVVTDKDTSQKLKQTNITSQLLRTMHLDFSALTGEAALISPDGMEVQKLTYVAGNPDWYVSKAYYGYDKASVLGTFIALTGIKIGASDYNDPSAKMVATEDYVITAIQNLSDILMAKNGAAHNAIYRGKNLGNAVTAEQFSEIQNGTFADMFIGDYWVINGTTYRIAAFDYYCMTGDNGVLTTHHITLVPDANMYTYKMNDSNTTAGGYAGSKMRTTGLSQALSTVETDFGAAHILSHRTYLTNSVSNGRPNGMGWYNSKIELMSEHNLFGAKIYETANDGVNVPAVSTVDRTQFPLFALNPSMIANGAFFWGQTVVSATDFLYVPTDGRAHHLAASGAYGVRPAFSIIG